MNRQEKECLIQSLRDDFVKSHAMFIVNVHGLTVSQVQQLRKNLFDQHGKLRVAKNTLARKVAKEFLGIDDLAPHLKHQIGLVFAMQESPAVAKVVCAASAENAQIKVIAGCFEAKTINAEMIKFLASLPPRQVLLAQVCGALKAPLAQPVNIMHQVLVRLVCVLKQASEKA